MNTEFMELAIEWAKKSGEDVPVGAIIVRSGEVIASAHNEKEKRQDSTLHAEIIAIKEASFRLGNWRLADCELYVTLEPCPMCAAAIIQSRLARVYFGSYDLLYGALGSKIDLRQTLSSNLEVKGGILQEKCDNVINSYFKGLR